MDLSSFVKNVLRKNLLLNIEKNILKKVKKPLERILNAIHLFSLKIHYYFKQIIYDLIKFLIYYFSSHNLLVCALLKCFHLDKM